MRRWFTDVTWQRVLDALGFYLSPVSIFRNSADPLLLLFVLAGMNALAFSASPALGIPVLIAALVGLAVIAVYRLQRRVDEQIRRDEVLHGLSKLMNVGVMTAFNTHLNQVNRTKWQMDVVMFLGDHLGGNYQARWTRLIARHMSDPNVADRVERLFQDELDLLVDIIKELTDPTTRPRRVVIPPG